MTRSVFNHRRGFSFALDPLTWTQHTIAQMGITSNQAYLSSLNSAPEGFQVSSVDPGYADCKIKLTLATRASTGQGGVLFRYVDNNNFWAAYWTGTGGFLIKVQSGSTTTVTSNGTNFSASGDYTTITLNGSSIDVGRNGSAGYMTATNSFNSTATKHGIYVSSLGARFDDFSIATLGNDHLCSDSFNRTNSATNLGATDGN